MDTTNTSLMESLHAANPKWKESLETGHQVIDRQHRELLGKIDALLMACAQGKGKEEVGTMMVFLNAYVQYHFEEEEKFQRWNEFPALAAHKGQHDTLLSMLRDLEKQFQEDGGTIAVLANSLKLTYFWLKEHIFKEDQAMVHHAKSRGKARH